MLHKRRLWVTFALTFLSGTAEHAIRQCWYMVAPTQVKYDFKVSQNVSTETLGAIDFSFLTTYSIGLFFSGAVANVVSLRTMLLLSCTATSTIYGLVTFASMVRLRSFPLYVFLWAMQGFAQSMLTASNLLFMNQWFPYSTRGRVMSFWGSYAAIGNICGEWMVVFLEQWFGLGWQYTILTISLLNAAIGLLAAIFLKERPATEALLDQPQLVKVSFWQAWRLKGVINGALAYGCVKMVNSIFNFWLPYYVDESFRADTTLTGSMASFYDFGTLFGTVAAGTIGDWLGMRALVLVAMLLGSLPALFCLTVAKDAIWFMVIVPIVGVLIGGCYSMLAVVTSQDLAEQTSSKGTVIGIVNGTGSLGAAIGQLAVRTKQVALLINLSWQVIFIYILLVTALSVVSLASLAIDDIKKHKAKS